ncbi:MAG: lysine--tRNA ligase [Gammaproteobacteria bacterium]
MADETPLLTEQEQNEQLAQRKEKLAALRQQGNPFVNDFRRNALVAEITQSFTTQAADALEANPHQVKIAGRIMTKRMMGKASFIHIQDMTGRLQIYIKADTVNPTVYEQFKTWDLGDIIGITGVVFKTKTGELSVKAEKLCLLTKSLRPLPDKFHGLTDHEARFRQRYLDLLVNERSRQIFEIRSKLVAGIRRFLMDRGYLEVETPMMHPIAGGAAAQPFTTHHNALDMDLYLRIAPELYLKRLVVGGMERVFEINRNFRNEGISTRHNPEFTMLEFYQAYADYHDLMDLTEQMLRALALEILSNTVMRYQGEEYDLAQPFTRMTVKEAILHFNPTITTTQIDDLTTAKAIAQGLSISVPAHYSLGKIQYEIFEKTVEKQLKNPTFITAFPIEVSPLARKNDQNPLLADRFEFFVGGKEIANGFSELNDPEDQAERFRQQVQDREAGDVEAMRFDADYIIALEHGLPPTAGEGIGIDRLTMLFTDSPSIRDVILFPLLRPQN